MSKFLEGPWFLWKEEAMRREGFDRDGIDIALTDDDADLTILAGVPSEITRGCVSGIKMVIEVDACMDYDEDYDLALATARLIATAPEIFEALTECLKMLKSASNQISDHHRVYLEGRTWGEKEIELAEAAISKVNGKSLGLENWLRRNPGHG